MFRNRSLPSRLLGVAAAIGLAVGLSQIGRAHV